jgi:hypothetical protein
VTWSLEGVKANATPCARTNSNGKAAVKVSHAVLLAYRIAVLICLLLSMIGACSRHTQGRVLRAKTACAYEVFNLPYCKNTKNIYLPIHRARVRIEQTSVQRPMIFAPPFNRPPPRSPEQVPLLR